MSLKGAEAFLRSHVAVQHAIRKLLESSEPLALMKLANMGPREKRSEVWPALEDLRKGGVLEASESNVMDLRTVAVRIAAKYRETLTRIILSGNKIWIRHLGARTRSWKNLRDIWLKHLTMYLRYKKNTILHFVAALIFWQATGLLKL